MGRDGAVRSEVRRHLPAATFDPKPLRCLFLVPLVGAAAGTSIALMAYDPPWPLMLLASVLIGNVYASLMFLTHELGHGAIVRSRRLALALMYPGCAVFLFSPHLWVVWHNRSHHGHTNRPDEDPDSFGTVQAFREAPRWNRRGARVFPGPGFVNRPGFRGGSIPWK